MNIDFRRTFPFALFLSLEFVLFPPLSPPKSKQNRRVVIGNYKTRGIIVNYSPSEYSPSEYSPGEWRRMRRVINQFVCRMFQTNLRAVRVAKRPAKSSDVNEKEKERERERERENARARASGLARERSITGARSDTVTSVWSFGGEAKSIAMLLHEVITFCMVEFGRRSTSLCCPLLLTHTHRRLRCIIPHSKQHIAYPP